VPDSRKLHAARQFTACFVSASPHRRSQACRRVCVYV